MLESLFKKIMKSKDENESSDDPRTETNHTDTEGCNFGLNPMELPYLWYPNQENVNHLEYVRRLECEFTCLQRAFLALTTQFTRLQFRIRQIVQAEPCEREALLLDLEHMAFNETEENDELPHLQRDAVNMGDVRRKQNLIIESLREKLSALGETESGEAESGRGVPELDTESPAANSTDAVTCFGIKKKRKPPPDTPIREGNETGRISSTDSMHSSSSKTGGTSRQTSSDYDSPRNGTLKQRISYVEEEVLAMQCNPNATSSMPISGACVEVCVEKLTYPVGVSRKSQPTCECSESCEEKLMFPVRKATCECNKSMTRHMNDSNTFEHK